MEREAETREALNSTVSVIPAWVTPSASSVSTASGRRSRCNPKRSVASRVVFGDWMDSRRASSTTLESPWTEQPVQVPPRQGSQVPVALTQERRGSAQSRSSRQRQGSAGSTARSASEASGRSGPPVSTTSEWPPSEREREAAQPTTRSARVALPRPAAGLARTTESDPVVRCGPGAANACRRVDRRSHRLVVAPADRVRLEIDDAERVVDRGSAPTECARSEDLISVRGPPVVRQLHHRGGDLSTGTVRVERQGSPALIAPLRRPAPHRVTDLAGATR
jgi:hypothetical protein